MDAPDDTSVITLTEEQFTKAVTAASVAVDRDRRNRVLLAAFIAGLLASALIALPVVWATGHANCRAVSQLANATERRFTESSRTTALFRAQSKDRFGLTEEQFARLLQSSAESERGEIAAVKHVAHRDCAFV